MDRRRSENSKPDIDGPTSKHETFEIEGSSLQTGKIDCRLQETQEEAQCKQEHQLAQPDPATLTTRTKFIIAGILMCSTSAQPIFATFSKRGGAYKYNFATVPLLAETIKFSVSMAMLGWKVVLKESDARLKKLGSTNDLAAHLDAPARPASPLLLGYRLDWTRVRMTITWGTLISYLVPSIIYVLINNLAFHSLLFMTPSTFQILNNLKILTTGIAFRIFMQRPLSELKWIALMLLLCGCTTSQISTDMHADGDIFRTPLMGYVCVIVSAFLSASAGVYTEYILKANNDSLDWQQMQLYGWGVLLNIIALTIRDIHSGFEVGAWPVVLLEGYNWAAFICVANLAFAGMLTSAVLKFADAIVKVIASSMAMLLTTIISISFFNEPLTIQVFLGIIISSLSVRLYYVESPAASKAAGSSGSSGARPSPPKEPV